MLHANESKQVRYEHYFGVKIVAILQNKITYGSNPHCTMLCLCYVLPLWSGKGIQFYAKGNIISSNDYWLTSWQEKKFYALYIFFYLEEKKDI